MRHLHHHRRKRTKENPITRILPSTICLLSQQVKSENNNHTKNQYSSRQDEFAAQ
jgi:hypothetical protein